MWDSDAELYFYRARWYDPAIGRFISEDPIGFASGDTNLYRYVKNSPTNYRDPLGLSPWDNRPDTIWENDPGTGTVYIHVYEPGGLLSTGQKIATITYSTSGPDWAEQRDIARKLAWDISNADAAGKIAGIISNAIDSGVEIGIRLSCDVVDNILSAKEFAENPDLRNLLGILPLIPGIARKIGSGHAWAKHAHEFSGITTQDEFARHIQNIMQDTSNPTRNLKNGRKAWWDESSGTVVIYDPKNPDKGTAFKPVNGRQYFENLQ